MLNVNTHITQIINKIKEQIYYTEMKNIYTGAF